MIRKLLQAVMAIAFPIAAAAPANAYDRLPASLARLSPTDFAGKVRIFDDPLEPKVVLSTEDGYKRGRSIRGAQADDVHLRALVDRRTGRVSWQVWHELSYVVGPRHLEAVHYQNAGALERSQVIGVENRLDGCPPTDGIGSCHHVTKVGFELPDHAVREIAQAYRPGRQVPWRLRFKDRKGRDITGGLAPAEVAGLVSAVENWRRADS